MNNENKNIENNTLTHTHNTESPFKQLYGLLLNAINEFAGEGKYKPVHVYFSDATSPIKEVSESEYKVYKYELIPTKHYITIKYSTTKDSAERYASAYFEKVEEAEANDGK